MELLEEKRIYFSIANQFMKNYSHLPGVIYAEPWFDNEWYLRIIVDNSYQNTLPSTFKNMKLVTEVWLKSQGRIIYDPPRPGLVDSQWWMVIITDPGIDEYYRGRIKNEYHNQLIKPNWGSHISVIKGEYPKKEYSSETEEVFYARVENFNKNWKYKDRQKVNFWYEHNVKFKYPFYWVDVICPDAKEIRRNLWLKHDWFLHLTIGQEKY